MQSGDAYSDALAVLLLTSDDVVTKYRLNAGGRILRPMSLASDRDLSEEFSLFFPLNHRLLILIRSPETGSRGAVIFPRCSAAPKNIRATGSSRVRHCNAGTGRLPDALRRRRAAVCQYGYRGEI